MQSEFSAEHDLAALAVPGDDTNTTEKVGRDKLFNRNFLLLIIGQGISLIGDSFYLTTLLVWVLTLAQSSTGTAAAKTAATAAASGGVLGAVYLASFLVGPFAGVFVDRWNRRQAMIISAIGQAITCLLPLTALLIAPPLRILAIIISAFLVTACANFFTPAQAGVIQVIVPQKRLPQAVSLLQFLSGFGGLIGAAIASPLFLALGPAIAIIANAASFLVAAFFIRLIQAPRESLHPYAYRQTDTAATPSAGRAVLSVFRQLFAGFRYVFTTRLLLIVLIIITVDELGAGAVNTLGTLFFTQHLHGTVALYGSFSSLSGLGTLLGALATGLLARWIRPQYLLAATSILMGVDLVVYATETVLLAGFITYFILGLLQGIFLASYLTIIIANSEKSVVGRVQGSITPFTQLLGLLSAAVGGILGGILALSSFIAAAGIVLLLAGLLGVFALRGMRQTAAEKGYRASLTALNETAGTDVYEAGINGAETSGEPHPTNIE